MSPRRNRSSGPGEARPLNTEGFERVEHGADGEWRVRNLTGAGSGKTYRCPGCDQEIAPGTPHVVAWPAYGAGSGTPGVGERRHWHTPCWRARARRR